jgi:glycopeptide antibiotics resistance protein
VVFISGDRSEIHSRSVNLLPVKQRIDELRNIQHRNGGELLNFFSNFFGNIILFIPFAAVVLQVLPMLSNKRIIFLAFFTSISIEICQFIFERGISDVDDITLNVAGAMAGLILYRMYTRMKSTYLQA